MAYYYRGVSLVSLRQPEQSLPDFDKAIASNELPDQDLVRAHQWHGIALLNLERYEEALPDFTRCVELEPDKPFHRLERGRVYEAAGQTENAIADYTVYLEQSSDEGALAAEARQRLEKLRGGPAEELQK
jgi:tetratricopeptide (TPR) repeat protein